MGLSCPSCGNKQHFQVKTLQIHVVQVDGEHVGISQPATPSIFLQNVPADRIGQD